MNWNLILMTLPMLKKGLNVNGMSMVGKSGASNVEFGSLLLLRKKLSDHKTNI